MFANHPDRGESLSGEEDQRSEIFARKTPARLSPASLGPHLIDKGDLRGKTEMTRRFGPLRSGGGQVSGLLSFVGKHFFLCGCVASLNASTT